MPQVRLRFAPSPTGEPHLGNIRTALFNWLFVKKNQGKFILRIEDTDRERLIPGSVEKILEGLEWLGLDYDNIYYQSERLEIYDKYVKELLNKGNAYYCDCSSKRLNEMREKQIKEGKPPMYDRRCRELNLKKGQVIRLKIPKTGIIKFKDLVHGEIKIENKVIDDQVLIKSDGFPTYHLANVVDDHLMGITHVLRAEEWLPSTAKHILLYQAFNWQFPEFIHCPMILGPDKSKLSKRHGAISLLEYKRQGYLPEALINFMALLGWNPGIEQEIFSKEELIKKFSLEKINKSPAVFNLEKLDWLNGCYLRQISLDQLTNLSVPFLEKDGLIKKEGSQYIALDTKEKIDFDYLKKIVSLEQERIKKLNEIGKLTKFFFIGHLNYDPLLLIWKKANKEDTLSYLKIIQEYLLSLSEKEFEKNILEQKIKEFILSKNLKTGDILWPMRAALTGEKASPSPFEVAWILGKRKTLERLQKARELLKK